jgi:hypothetical protein
MAFEPAGEADRGRDASQHQRPDWEASGFGPVSPAAGEAGALDPARTGADGAQAAPGARLREPVLLGLKRIAGAARRAPVEALAAAGIGAAALVLALLAADGEAESSKRAFDPALPVVSTVSPSVDASNAAMDPEALARAALAGRLVEDPAFDREPPQDQQATSPPVELSPPLEPAAEPGEAGWEGDPLAVLSAASPPPADPALRVLERLRAQRSPAAAAPSSPSLSPLPSPSEPGSAATGLRHGFAVQLLAVGRKDQAERAWDRLRDENPDLLGRLQPMIARPEPRPNALFRLRAGPVASVEDARALCAALSGRGVDCIVVQGG